MSRPRVRDAAGEAEPQPTLDRTVVPVDDARRDRAAGSPLVRTLAVAELVGGAIGALLTVTADPTGPVSNLTVLFVGLFLAGTVGLVSTGSTDGSGSTAQGEA